MCNYPDKTTDNGIGKGKPMPRYATILCHNLLIFAFLVLACAGVFAQPAAIFARDARVGVGPQAIVVADFNGDGKPDIATANVSGSVAILLNNGDGTFANGVNILVPGTPSSLVTADFNGDGKPDLAVSAPDSATVTIFMGNGDGTFAASTLSLGISAARLAIGDFNGDGRPDIVGMTDIPAAGYGYIAVALGRGNGTFRPAQTTYTPNAYQPLALAAGQFDGDGKLDLAVISRNDTRLITFAGTGDGKFGATTIHLTGNNPLTSLTLADINSDGLPDFVTGPWSYYGGQVLLGDGIGGFSTNHPFSLRNTPVAFAAADLDGDGKQEIVAAESDGYAGSYIVGILRGNGDGSSQAENAIALNAAPNDIKIADVNGDGKPDVIVAERYANCVGVLFSNGDGTLQAENDYAVGVNPFAIPGVPGAKSVAVGDFNRDGKLDFVIPTATGVLVVPGNGAGTFGVPVPLAIDGGAVYVAVGDVDGDGKPDLVTSNNKNADGICTVSVLFGNGNGTFQSPVYRFTRASGPVAVADIAGNGKPAVLTDYTLDNNPTFIFFTVFTGWTPGTTGGSVNYTGGAASDILVGDFNGDGKGRTSSGVSTTDRQQRCLDDERHAASPTM